MRSATPILCAGVGFLVVGIMTIFEEGPKSIADEVGYFFGACVGLRCAQLFF